MNNLIEEIKVDMQNSCYNPIDYIPKENYVEITIIFKILDKFKKILEKTEGDK